MMLWSQWLSWICLECHKKWVIIYQWHRKDFKPFNTTESSCSGYGTLWWPYEHGCTIPLRWYPVKTLATPLKMCLMTRVLCSQHTMLLWWHTTAVASCVVGDICRFFILRNNSRSYGAQENRISELPSMLLSTGVYDWALVAMLGA